MNKKEKRRTLRQTILGVELVILTMLLRTILLIVLITEFGPTEDFITVMNALVGIEAIIEFIIGAILVYKDCKRIDSDVERYLRIVGGNNVGGNNND